jgi:hypothetical protein
VRLGVGQPGFPSPTLHAQTRGTNRAGYRRGRRGHGGKCVRPRGGLERWNISALETLAETRVRHGRLLHRGRRTRWGRAPWQSPQKRGRSDVWTSKARPPLLVSVSSLGAAFFPDQARRPLIGANAQFVLDVIVRFAAEARKTQSTHRGQRQRDLRHESSSRDSSPSFRNIRCICFHSSRDLPIIFTRHRGSRAPSITPDLPRSSQTSHRSQPCPEGTLFHSPKFAAPRRPWVAGPGLDSSLQEIAFSGPSESTAGHIRRNASVAETGNQSGLRYRCVKPLTHGSRCASTQSYGSVSLEETDSAMGGARWCRGWLDVACRGHSQSRLTANRQKSIRGLGRSPSPSSRNIRREFAYHTKNT